MYLKSQDVVILLKLSLAPSNEWSYNQMAYELRMSPSEIHKGVKRAVQARLLDAETKHPRRKALEEFLIHGVKYAYAPDIGGMTRGMPTAFGASGLRDHFSSGEELYVWPEPEGGHRGLSFSPLYRTVPEAARNDERLYRALSALDAIRFGRAREKKMAEDILLTMLGHHV